MTPSRRNWNGKMNNNKIKFAITLRPRQSKLSGDSVDGGNVNDQAVGAHQDVIQSTTLNNATVLL